MSKKIGSPQWIQYLAFKDCLKRTKKQDKEEYKNTTDLVFDVLANSSIVERGTERSFHEVCDAINVLNKFLCPGQWCTRTHCKDYSSRSAYHCRKTRPVVCKEYKAYIEKRNQKKSE